MESTMPYQFETASASHPGACHPERTGHPERPGHSEVRRGVRPASSRSGFTLTELLVVIAIIGVLASLIAVAAKAALDASNRAAVVLEIKNMGGAIEDLKNDYGAYPPNVMSNGSNQAVAQVTQDALRMFKKAYPRADAQELEIVKSLCGMNHNSSIVTISTDPIDGGMTAAEALVFWVGGFSSDERFPLSGPGGPSHDNDPDAGGELLDNRTWRWQFDIGRLTPRDDDGFFDEDNGRYVEYQIDMNGNGNIESNAGEERRINLWYYAPKGSEESYRYFDVSRYRPSQYDPWAFDPAINSDATRICAIKQRRPGSTSTNPARRVQFVDQGKFQILHAGLDDVWGDFNFMKVTGPNGQVRSDIDIPDDMILLPEGPFTGELADTLTSFTDGTLEDAQEE